MAQTLGANPDTMPLVLRLSFVLGNLTAKSDRLRTVHLRKRNLSQDVIFAVLLSLYFLGGRFGFFLLGGGGSGSPRRQEGGRLLLKIPGGGWAGAGRVSTGIGGGGSQYFFGAEIRTKFENLESTKDSSHLATP